MSDTAVQFTHHSFGNRLSNSCKQLMMAPILLIVGIYILIWNEGNSVKQHQALHEGLSLVVDLYDNVDTIDPIHNGQLIHFTGFATTPSPNITDPIFGAVAGSDEAHPILQLKRTVEMYQWNEKSHSETTKNTGGSTDTKTTYTYSKTWSNIVIDSSRFYNPEGHENPTEMLFDNQFFMAPDIHVGAFSISSVITSKMAFWWQPLSTPLSTETITEDTTKLDAKVFNNQFYFGDTPSSPQIGDTRISFQDIPSQTISVVAQQQQQSGGGLSAFMASNGASILLVERGQVTPEIMFQHANKAVTLTTWLIRMGGYIIIYIAFHSVMQPLQVCADCIPCIGDIIEAGNSCVVGFLAFVTSTLVIAISWFAYRPMLSACLIALIIVVTLFMKKQRRQNATTSLPTVATTATFVKASSYELPQGQFKDSSDDNNEARGGFSSSYSDQGV